MSFYIFWSISLFMQDQKYKSGFYEFMQIMKEQGRNRPVAQLLATFVDKDRAKAEIYKMAEKRVLRRISKVEAITRKTMQVMLEFVDKVNAAVLQSPGYSGPIRVNTSPLAFFLVNYSLREYYATHDVINIPENRKGFIKCIRGFPDEDPWDIEYCYETESSTRGLLNILGRFWTFFNIFVVVKRFLKSNKNEWQVWKGDISRFYVPIGNSLWDNFRNNLHNFILVQRTKNFNFQTKLICL